MARCSWNIDLVIMRELLGHLQFTYFHFGFLNKKEYKENGYIGHTRQQIEIINKEGRGRNHDLCRTLQLQQESPALGGISYPAPQCSAAGATSAHFLVN